MSYEHLASDHIRVPATGKPECLLTWITRPEGGIRLFASRDLADTGWGQRSDLSRPTVDWHLDVTMANVLIVDRQTPAEAIQWVLERWMREDAEQRQREIEAIERKAIGQPVHMSDHGEEDRRRREWQQHERIGMMVNDPKAIIQGLPNI